VIDVRHQVPIDELACMSSFSMFSVSVVFVLPLYVAVLKIHILGDYCFFCRYASHGLGLEWSLFLRLAISDKIVRIRPIIFVFDSNQRHT
jgi:hypothetical protein